MLISSRGAPALTAAATLERTRSTRLPVHTRPLDTSLSIASEASTTPSKASPACTRLAASTPPTDSISTAMPDTCSQASANSANTWRVAMEEISFSMRTPLTITEIF